MTIAALQQLLDDELPHVRRPPAPRLNLPRWSAKEYPDMTTTAEPPTTEPAEFNPAHVIATELGDLVAWGDAHTDTEVQALAAQALATVTELYERRQRDAELATVDKELAELEARAEALRARQAQLQPAKPARKARGHVDYPAAEVRAWAREAGLQCPATGRVPAAIVEAWRNRHGMEG